MELDKVATGRRYPSASLTSLNLEPHIKPRKYQLRAEKLGTGGSLYVHSIDIDIDIRYQISDIDIRYQI